MQDRVDRTGRIGQVLTKGTDKTAQFVIKPTRSQKKKIQSGIEIGTYWVKQGETVHTNDNHVTQTVRNDRIQ